MSFTALFRSGMVANLTTRKVYLKRKQKSLAFHGPKSLKPWVHLNRTASWMEGGKRLGVLALPSPLILTLISKLFTTTKALHAHSAAPCKQGKEPERCTKTSKTSALLQVSVSNQCSHAQGMKVLQGEFRYFLT